MERYAVASDVGAASADLERTGRSAQVYSEFALTRCGSRLEGRSPTARVALSMSSSLASSDRTLIQACLGAGRSPRVPDGRSPPVPAVRDVDVRGRCARQAASIQGCRSGRAACNDREHRRAAVELSARAERLVTSVKAARRDSDRRVTDREAFCSLGLGPRNATLFRSPELRADSRVKHVPSPVRS